jgi:hypothetical protein
MMPGLYGPIGFALGGKITRFSRLAANRAQASEIVQRDRFISSQYIPLRDVRGAATLLGLPVYGNCMTHNEIFISVVAAEAFRHYRSGFPCDSQSNQ